jgi:hypothetical protein
MAASHPDWLASGNDGRMCNHRLAPVVVRDVPLGNYVLSAHMVIEAQAGGLLDAHAAADFSPSANLPADFARLRDSFQNTDKKNFGFTIMLTATPSGPNPPHVSRAMTRTNATKENQAVVQRAAGDVSVRPRIPYSR